MGKQDVENVIEVRVEEIAQLFDRWQGAVIYIVAWLPRMSSSGRRKANERAPAGAPGLQLILVKDPYRRCSTGLHRFHGSFRW
jgi:hypothetical protein